MQSNKTMAILIICSHKTTIRGAFERSSDTSTIIRRRFIWIFSLVSPINTTDHVSDVRGRTSTRFNASCGVYLHHPHGSSRYELNEVARFGGAGSLGWRELEVNNKPLVCQQAWAQSATSLKGGRGSPPGPLGEALLGSWLAARASSPHFVRLMVGHVTFGGLVELSEFCLVGAGR
jgi:hypothetical protein